MVDAVVLKATEEKLSSQALLLRATALHSLHEWKLFLLQNLRDKYSLELLPGFDALPAAQKIKRITDLKEFYVSLHVDNLVKDLAVAGVRSRSANGANLTLWYEFLQSRIQALPAVPDL